MSHNSVSKQVFGTVLKFFASYFFHFLGYAIAFHILLKGGQGDSFDCFGDSFIKVILIQNIFTITLVKKGNFYQ